MALNQQIRTLVVMAFTALLPTTALAAPWCNQGKIAVISNQSWNGQTILHHFQQATNSYSPQPPCSSTTSIEHCTSFTAMRHFAKTLAGGSPGKFCRTSIPDMMTTRHVATAPHSYINGGPYTVQDGIVFRVEKCFCNSIDAVQPLPKAN